MRSSSTRPGLFARLPGLLATYTVTTSHLLVDNWWTEFLRFGLPFVLMVSLVVMALAVILRPTWPHFIMPVVLFLVTMKPMRETCVLALRPEPIGHDFTVMSFNAALFNPYRPHTLDSHPELYHQFYDHLRAEPAADVLCIQEFFHSSQAVEELAVDSIVHLGDYSFFYANPSFDEKYQGMVSAAIFSRLPVVGSGRVDLSGSLYDGCWSDVVAKADTVRVVNFQLRSMSIRPLWVHRLDLVGNLVFNLLNIHDRLRAGWTARRKEMDEIDAFLTASPHPVIVCADINALPYSTTYQRLKRRYANSFETAGSGFGFTYHHFPWLIRIDNQFFDARLRATWFHTRRDLHISDHYPIMTGYAVE